MNLKITDKFVNAIKRFEDIFSQSNIAIDGSASECHYYYCPYNISELESDDNGYCDSDYNDGYYKGKNDGFDSDCPRFLAIDREKNDWTCLCGLEIIAMLLDVDYKELYEKLIPYFKNGKEEFPNILGYNKKWRKE